MNNSTGYAQDGPYWTSQCLPATALGRSLLMTCRKPGPGEEKTIVSDWQLAKEPHAKSTRKRMHCATYNTMLG